MGEKAKRISDSKTENVQILMSGHLNGNKRLFGGMLMEWIDVVAAVVARRHCNAEVTTAAVDQLEFKAPIFINSTVILKGKITYVGKTSMEVRVDTFVESLTGETEVVNKAYLVLVALDCENHPKPVPRIILETDEERQEWAAGEKRHALRKQRRVENY